MKITEKIDEIRNIVSEWRAAGLSVGLVPTMGFLHEGHKSLIERAVSSNDRVIVSDFVNPMQFGPSEDLGSYPRDLDQDEKLCESAGADVIFHPAPSEMYNDDFSSFVDMTTLTGGLCGRTRPIHFRGVCTVITKLLNITTPDRAYFGQKDAQQLAVIMHMVSDLNFDTKIIGCPIIREADGLAKSSRNTYLSADERAAATILSKALGEGCAMLGSAVTSGSPVTADALTAAIRKVIESEPLAKIDYVEAVSWPGLEPIETADGPLLCAVAVYIGKTRLIDNFISE